MIEKVSKTLDEILENIFRKLSPTFRGRTFSRPESQKSILSFTGIVFIVMVIVSGAMIFQEQDGITVEHEFLLEREESTSREFDGVDFQDELDVHINSSRKVNIVFFICHESEYEEYEKGDKEIEDLETVVLYRGDIWNDRKNTAVLELSGASEADGTFVAFMMNNDTESADIAFMVETFPQPAYTCGACMIVFLVGAVLLFSSSRSIVTVLPFGISPPGYPPGYPPQPQYPPVQPRDPFAEDRNPPGPDEPPERPGP